MYKKLHCFFKRFAGTLSRTIKSLKSKTSDIKLPFRNLTVPEPQETIPEAAQEIETMTETPKVVVESVSRDNSAASNEEPTRISIANGQQPAQSAAADQNQSSSNTFVLTPDYIQQS